jgi:hypothetical protein
MSPRNIDFWAVAAITVVMGVYSWTSSLKIDQVVSPIDVRTAANGDACPITDALQRISDILNQ